MTSTDRPTFPPRWLQAFGVLLVLAIIAVRFGDVAGDGGATNVFTGLLVFLGLLTTLFWFVVRSGHPLRLRLGTLGVVVALVVAFFGLFRFETMRGAMIPVFVSRFAERPDLETPAPGVATIGADLLTTTEGDFPEFLGPGRDLRVDNVRLAREWDTAEPQLMWSQPIGAGRSGIAAVNGYAATIEQRDRQELATLYEITTGDLMWSYVLADERFEHILAGTGPRSTPTIDGGIVYVMSVHGRLVALDGATGAPVWDVDLLDLYGISRQEESELLPYGRPASPLVLRDLVVVATGGSRARRVSLAAFDKLTGELRWEGGERQISMASPAVAMLAGQEQLLLVNENWVTGYSPVDGRVLWEFEWPGLSNADASVSQAVPVAPDRVFISKGYGSGAALYQLQPASDGTYQASQLWHQSRSLRTKMTNVAIRNGHVYGLSEGILECVDLATGERAWKGGRYGHGQILMVGDLLLVLTEDGDLVMVEATPERSNNVLGRITALDGVTWNNLALYGDVLLVRNAQVAAAWRLPLAGVGE